MLHTMRTHRVLRKQGLDRMTPIPGNRQMSEEPGYPCSQQHINLVKTNFAKLMQQLPRRDPTAAITELHAPWVDGSVETDEGIFI